MLNKILYSLWMALMVGIGFYVPDYFNGVFDRANIAVPIAVFFNTMLVMLIYSEK
jgi:hypothetical protein